MRRMTIRRWMIAVALSAVALSGRFSCHRPSSRGGFRGLYASWGPLTVGIYSYEGTHALVFEVKT